MTAEHKHPEGASGPGRAKWVLIGFLAVAGFFLLAEHRAHALAVLPYFLLLACPLMHFFMHGGHGHGGHGRHSDGEAEENKR